MIRNRRLKWPTPYGIQLETSLGLRDPFSDGRSQRICDYLRGSTETAVAESNAQFPCMDRASNAEIATDWHTNARAGRQGTAPRGSRREANASDSDPSDAAA